jgi:L-arabinose isomerase
LPIALQVGMTEKQYWNDDPEKLSIYHKSYMQRIHQEAHIYGYYVFQGMSIALNNFIQALNGKTFTPKNYISKPLITSDEYFRKEITKENLTKEYRRGLDYQMNWVNNLSSNK